MSRISLAFAAVFFIAVLVSGYMLYSLPTRLMLPAGSGMVIFKAYAVVTIAFLLGGFTIYLALQSRKELIVYKEKTTEDKTVEGESDESQKSTISLESVKGSLAGGATRKDFYQNFMQALCTSLEAGQGALYLVKENGDNKKLSLSAGYALSMSEDDVVDFDLGEGLIGQAASEKKSLYVDDVPEGYIKIVSGLGSSSPRYLFISPVKKDDKVTGVVEIASFKKFSDDQRKFVEEAAHLLADKIVTTSTE